MDTESTTERISSQTWKYWTPEWNGLICVECGVDLRADTIWCDDCSAFAAEIAAEKAELGGLSRFEYHAVGNVDNDVVRGHLHEFGVRINQLRASERRPMLSEHEARKVLLARARLMLTVQGRIRDSGPRGSSLRELLESTMDKVIEEEAWKLVFAGATDWPTRPRS